MPRTDEQIAEYLSYYAQQGRRQWAIDTLVQTEGKTAEEIMHIWRGGRVKRAAQSRTPKSKYSDEFLKNVEADRAAGMTYKDLADTYRMPLKQINSIMSTIRQKKKKASPTREPEAYPEQIYDDEPEPIVESDVKVFIPGELPTDEVIELDVPEPVKLPYIPYKKPEIIEPPAARACTTDDSNTIKPPLPRKSVWFAIRDELRDTALGMFGHGTELIAENVHIDQHAEVQVRTPDGENIILTVRKVAYDN